MNSYKSVAIDVRRERYWEYDIGINVDIYYMAYLVISFPSESLRSSRAASRSS